MKLRYPAAALAVALLLAIGSVPGAAAGGSEATPLVATLAPAGDESQPTRALSEEETAAAARRPGGEYTTLESGTVQYGDTSVSREYSLNGNLLVLTEDYENGRLHFALTDEDGNRQALASLPAGGLDYDFVALRGNSLYFVLEKDGEAQVTRLDLSTGEDGLVMCLSGSQSCIGASGERLALVTHEAGGDARLSLVDDAGREETLTSFAARGASYGFFDESFYLVQHATGVVTKTDLASGVETVLGQVPALPGPSGQGAAGGSYHFVEQIGETLILEIQENKDDAARGESTRWLLDIYGWLPPAQADEADPGAAIAPDSPL